MKQLNVKWLSIGIIIGLSISFGTFALAQTIQLNAEYNNIKIKIDKEIVDTEGNEPFIVNGRTYVPARYVAEGLGAKVDWNGEENTVMISTDTNNIEIRNGQLKQSEYDWLTAMDGQWWYNISVVKLVNPNFILWDTEYNADGIPIRSNNYKIVKFDTLETVLDNIPVKMVYTEPHISETYFNEVILPIIKE